MFAQLFIAALLSLTVTASLEVKRQATDAAQFTSAADQLISQYIPSTALPALELAVSSAAGVAQVTGEPLSLIYEALLSNSIPGWFSSAIPSAYSTQIAALESDINALRATSSTPGGPLLPVATAVTTTNSLGSTITTTLSPSSTGPSSSVTVTSTSISGVLATTTTTPSETATGAGGSVVSSLTTEVISGVTSIFSTAVSKASSAASVASSGVSSAISSSSSSAGGSLPTAVSGAAIVGMGVFGLIAAL